MKNAIGYLRVSTNEQNKDDRYGIEAQKEAISKYARENGYEIVEWAQDVISGVKESRPMLDGLLYDKEVGNPPYEAVIVYKRDRLSRDIQQYFYFYYLLKKKGVNLISATEPINEQDPTFNIQMALIIFVAEQERRNIMMRTKAGRQAKRVKGGHACGRVPFGYMAQHGVLVPNPSEVPIVKMIFEMRENRHMAFLPIANYLNESGIKTQRGNIWQAMSVKKIVDNKKTYQGFVRLNDTWVKGVHEAIL